MLKIPLANARRIARVRSSRLGSRPPSAHGTETIKAAPTVATTSLPTSSGA
jgi:hypothetical protein